MGSQDPLRGYEGRLRDILERLDVRIGDRLRIIKGNTIFEGILMPKTAESGKDILVLKLPNGYNVGIGIDEGVRIEVLERRGLKLYEEILGEETYIKGESDKLITIISTGGTIASRVEYETGAVRPALSAHDLVDLVPDLLKLGSIKALSLFSIFSEDMTPSHWSRIAEQVAKYIYEGADGVIIAHGTDTMAYTAAALAFALRNLPVPVALVGAQRSSDRPSTDALINLKGAAITVIKAPFAEVTVVMHGDVSDTYVLAHRGVKVRKMHSSRRDAFQSINDLPLAKVIPETNELIMINNTYIKRTNDKSSLILMNKFDDRVVLIKAYPGIDPEIIDMVVDRGYRGIVIEGTGLGHIANRCIPSIRRAIEEGIPVIMTTQTLFGKINMNVYTTGRRLLAAGVIPGYDMLPETAYVKLSWVLAQTRDLCEVRRLMLTNFVYEFNERHLPYHYPRWFHG